MTYRALMAHVHADPACEPRLRLAAELADEMGCALIGVAAAVYAPPPGLRADEGPITEAMDRQIEAELKEAEAQFRAVCGDVKAGLEWRGLKGPPVRRIAAEARAADLVIASPFGGAPGPRQTGEDASTLFEGQGFIERAAPAPDLLMAAGRPVLAGPAEVDRLDARRIVLAWKDAREARRAMADAMPFLVRAERVLVACAPEDGIEGDPKVALADVAEAIRRHGGHPSTRTLDAARPAAEAILEAAVEFDAPLIVAGGYGRSRLSEWVFGGVTRRLLDQDAKFVLMSH